MICQNITNITIGNNVARIEVGAFSNCTSLTSVIIPASVTNVGNYAFASCTSLKRVTISEGVKTIGDGAFENCSNLEEIAIPDSVTSIGLVVFRYCRQMTSITEPREYWWMLRITLAIIQVPSALSMNCWSSSLMTATFGAVRFHCTESWAMKLRQMPLLNVCRIYIRMILWLFQISDAVTLRVGMSS